MDKPFTVAIKETRETIAQAINNSNLHPCVSEMILKDIQNELHTLVQKITQEDELAYMNFLMSKEEKDELKDVDMVEHKEIREIIENDSDAIFIKEKEPNK